jgi:hypothetical protein
MGELARASPRACGGGVGAVGGRLSDVAAPGAWRRGLVIMCSLPAPDVVVVRLE